MSGLHFVYVWLEKYYFVGLTLSFCLSMSCRDQTQVTRLVWQVSLPAKSSFWPFCLNHETISLIIRRKIIVPLSMCSNSMPPIPELPCLKIQMRPKRKWSKLCCNSDRWQMNGQAQTPADRFRNRSWQSETRPYFLISSLREANSDALKTESVKLESHSREVQWVTWGSEVHPIPTLGWYFVQCHLHCVQLCIPSLSVVHKEAVHGTDICFGIWVDTSCF